MNRLSTLQRHQHCIGSFIATLSNDITAARDAINPISTGIFYSLAPRKVLHELCVGVIIGDASSITNIIRWVIARQIDLVTHSIT